MSETETGGTVTLQGAPDPVTGWAVMLAPGEKNSYANQPTVLHATEERARNEAERLCRKTGGRFIVLQAVAYVGRTEAPLAWHDGVPDNTVTLFGGPA